MQIMHRVAAILAYLTIFYYKITCRICRNRNTLVISPYIWSILEYRCTIFMKCIGWVHCQIQIYSGLATRCIGRGMGQANGSTFSILRQIIGLTTKLKGGLIVADTLFAQLIARAINLQIQYINTICIILLGFISYSVLTLACT